MITPGSAKRRCERIRKAAKQKGINLLEGHGGRTALHIAVSCRTSEIIRLLLEHGADVTFLDTLLDLSVVQFGSRMVDWKILSLIMEKRPKVREQILNVMKNGLTDYNVSVLRAVGKYGHTDLLTCRISKDNYTNIALRADNGTSLHVAARSGQTETVKTLFRLGAKPDTEDGKGKAPLPVLAECESYNVAKFVVECQETFQNTNELRCNGIFNRTIQS